MKSQFFFVAALGTVLLASAANCPAQSTPPQEQTSQNLEAKKWLQDGVEAYKHGQTDAAIADFARAKELDPASMNARLYLATAYSSQYIPGATSAENTQFGEKALKEYQDILATHPNNIGAIDGVGSILFNMANSPFSSDKMEESKSYHRKHIELAPNDPQGYYWIGVIDWMIAYQTNRALRAEWSSAGPKPLADTDPLPESVRAQFSAKCVATVQEGTNALQKAMSLKPDYDDAMAYLNLLYRQKAEMESSQAARDEDERNADELVEKVKAIKEKQLQEADQASQ